MTGRHRVGGKHRKPDVPHKLRPATRQRVLRVVCGCAFCAAVIPLFAQHAPDPANPPNLTSAAPAPVVLQPTPPVITIQPRVDTVDMLTAVNSEMAHGGDHGGHDGGSHDGGHDGGKSSSHEGHDSSSDSHDYSNHESHGSDSTPSDHGSDNSCH